MQKTKILFEGRIYTLGSKNLSKEEGGRNYLGHKTNIIFLQMYSYFKKLRVNEEVLSIVRL